MSYCTHDDIAEAMDADELIQATDDAGVGAVDAAKVTAAISDACTEIDGYLAARHVLPLPTVPALLKTLAKDIAIYRIYLRRMGPPEHRKDQYDNAVKRLGKIAEGKIGLGVDDPEPPAQDDLPEFESSEPVFGRSNMKAF